MKNYGLLYTRQWTITNNHRETVRPRYSRGIWYDDRTEFNRNRPFVSRNKSKETKERNEVYKPDFPYKTRKLGEQWNFQENRVLCCYCMGLSLTPISFLNEELHNHVTIIHGPCINYRSKLINYVTWLMQKSSAPGDHICWTGTHTSRLSWNWKPH
jgi:hypothetical protein